MASKATSSNESPSPLKRLRVFISGCLFPSDRKQQNQIPEEGPAATENEAVAADKKYVHVPQHAAEGFLRTATPGQMKKENEIL